MPVRTKPAVPLPQREIEICYRLRAFREGTLIPRTRFALTIGVGSERLASYEAGRVPLRYDVFKLINNKYFINPYWLATGDPIHGKLQQIDDSALGPINPRALFSDVFDLKFKPLAEQERSRALRTGGWETLLIQLKHFFATINPSDLKKFPRDERLEWMRVLKEAYQAIGKDLKFEASARKRTKAQ